MADEKKTVKETKEVSKGSKFVNFFKNLPQNIATPFKNMWHELKKVTWPTKQDLIKYTCIVLLFMVFMGIVIGLLDMGASKLVTAISSLKGTEEQIIIDTSDLGTEVEDAAEGAAETVEEAAQEAAEEVTEAVQEAAEQTEENAEAPASGN
ncbi:MAG: preprotein translocase subunit SecE [Clostridia bacterium]|nr:preprotein translocase subunit SecE [Clostridia bacterium]